MYEHQKDDSQKIGNIHFNKQCLKYTIKYKTPIDAKIMFKWIETSSVDFFLIEA